MLCSSLFPLALLKSSMVQMESQEVKDFNWKSWARKNYVLPSLNVLYILSSPHLKPIVFFNSIILCQVILREKCINNHLPTEPISNHYTVFIMKVVIRGDPRSCLAKMVFWDTIQRTEMQQEADKVPGKIIAPIRYWGAWPCWK